MIVQPLIDESPDRLLLSMDSGWYHVGDPDGGRIDGFTALPDRFLPARRRQGPASGSSASRLRPGFGIYIPLRLSEAPLLLIRLGKSHALARFNVSFLQGSKDAA